MTDEQDILPAGYAAHEPWSGPGHLRGPGAVERGAVTTGWGRRRHPVLMALLAIVVLIVILIVGVRVGRRQDQSERPPGPQVAVTIPAEGVVTSKIGSILAKAGVIHDSTIFALYVRINGDSRLYPGAYSLSKNSSYGSVISVLKAGPQADHRPAGDPEGATPCGRSPRPSRPYRNCTCRRSDS